MTKTIITHINPHLDEVAAIWVIRKYLSGWEELEIKFISADKGNAGLPEDEETIYLGVGRGKYDEHKGDLEDSAASLVWNDLREKVEGLEQKAVSELIDFVRLDDTGKLKKIDYPEFYVSGFIRSGSGEEDSRKNIDFGDKVLDRIFDVLLNKQKAFQEWESAVSVETKWGKGYAVKGSYVSRSFCDSQDGIVYLMVDPKHNSIQYYTPGDDVDLEPIYNKVKELDPKASWFLHQSHKMVICGSGSAPDSKPTKLNFEQLVEILKNEG
jgi:hypothetical protein